VRSWPPNTDEADEAPPARHKVSACPLFAGHRALRSSSAVFGGHPKVLHVTNQRVVVAIYGYSLTHIGSWWIWCSVSQNESWFPYFQAFFLEFFLPINLMAGGMCRLVWGSLNIFEARLVLGLVADVGIASILSATILAAAWLYWRGRVARNAHSSRSEVPSEVRGG
jgi:hypothetical protein